MSRVLQLLAARGGPSWRLLAMLRILHLKAGDDDALLAGLAHKHVSPRVRCGLHHQDADDCRCFCLGKRLTLKGARGRLSAANEAQVRDSLLALLHAVLAAYPTTLADDEARLAAVEAEAAAAAQESSKKPVDGAISGVAATGGDEAEVSAAAQEQRKRERDRPEGEEREREGLRACLRHLVSQKRIVRSNLDFVGAFFAAATEAPATAATTAPPTAAPDASTGKQTHRP